MPQLNPAPWLQTMFFSWSAFLIVAPQKILVHPLLNGPTPWSPEALKTTPWDWPWH